MTNALGDITSKVKDTVSGIPDKVRDVLNSPDTQKILPWALGAGGIGAVAGGMATGKRNAADGESRIGHLGRVLRNALISGGLAAGGTALLSKGVENTMGATDKLAPKTGVDDNEGPLGSTLRGVAFSPLSAAAAGGLGLAATHNMPGIGSVDSKGQAEALRSLARRVGGGDAAGMKEWSPERMHEAIQAVPEADEGRRIADKLRRVAGLASGEPSKYGWKGKLSEIVHSAPMSTLGHTAGRRIGRGALGLTAAALPALAGAFLTDDPHQS